MSERRRLPVKMLIFPTERVLYGPSLYEVKRGGSRIVDITSYRLMKEQNERREQRIGELFGDNPILDLEAYRQNRHNVIPTRFLFSASTLFDDLDRGLNYLASGHNLELKDA